MLSGTRAVRKEVLLAQVRNGHGATGLGHLARDPLTGFVA